MLLSITGTKYNTGRRQCMYIPNNLNATWTFSITGKYKWEQNTIKSTRCHEENTVSMH